MPNLYPKEAETTSFASLPSTFGITQKKKNGSSCDAKTNPFLSWLKTGKDCPPSTSTKPYTPQFEYKRVPAKEILFYKGDPAGQLFVILSGKVKVSAPSEDGKEIIFGIFGPGELVGEMGVLEDADHTATVTALESTELAILERRDFFLLLEQSPAIAIRLLTILCERLRRTSEIVEDISFLPLPIRLAKNSLSSLKPMGKTSLRELVLKFISINRNLPIWLELHGKASINNLPFGSRKELPVWITGI